MAELPVVVRVDDVSKRFVVRKEKSLKERLVNFGRSNRHKEDFWALRNVSLEIRAGTTIGLIGPNGSGKSTLLKTIGGIIQPTSGAVLRRGRLAALLELGAGFHPDLTGRENVYLNASILGLSKEETDGYFDDIVDFSGIGDFIDTQVKFYSSGMYVRLAFAVAVHVDPDVLIIDEVLAVGDEPFQRKCMDRIKQFQKRGKTIILVTHSLGQVSEFCDRAIVLERGNVVFDGEPGAAIRRLRDDFEVLREHDAAASDHEERLAIDHVELVGLNDEGCLVEGAQLVLRVKLKGADEGSRLVVGMGIEADSGVVVFGTNTELLGVPVVATATGAAVDFVVSDLRLGEGRFTVHASVGRQGLGEASRVPSAATFDVLSRPGRVGLVDAEIVARQRTDTGMAAI